MTTQPIHGFNGRASLGKYVTNLAGVIPALELMSLYIAATMHDYDHPGKTNSFLINTNDELAILYNDRSVLEQHHAASSWRILTKPENDFLSHLPKPERLKIRFIILECILSTDISKHYELIEQFRSKIGTCGHHQDFNDDSFRLLTCKMVIKMCDIGNCGK